MQYEITYILKPELTTEEQTAVGDFISQRIVTLKGKAQDSMRTFSVQRGGSDESNLRRFAYPIKHYRQGYYYSKVFDLKESNLAKLQKQVFQNEKILRFLIVKNFTPLAVVVESSTPTVEPVLAKNEEVLKEVQSEIQDKKEKSVKKSAKKTLESTTSDKPDTKATSKENIKKEVAKLDEQLDKILE